MLPETVKPKSYDIFLDIDTENFRYKGSVKILVIAEDVVDKVFLNSSGLKIKEVKVNEERSIFNLIPEKEILEISLPKFFNKEFEIKIDFEGEIKDNLVGIYRSKVDENEYIITTQLESIFARRVFPCFDEPKFKAEFKLSLMINKDLDAISNMPIEKEEIIDNKKIVHFQKTPKMSSYLLYIGVGKFSYLGDKIRIVATKDKAKLGKKALEFATNCLKFFEEYTGIKYPLPKLDLIAIPDFGAGAMENWGAITFREILLLFDDEKVSNEVKLRSFMVIAHELWHQWSGNLVTMKWWDDLWLNESFASYMAYKALKNFYPASMIEEYFIENEMEDALIRDFLKNTHPIRPKSIELHEIEEMFDEISYGKGACILRMIENYIGEKSFRDSIIEFLNKFAYSNASANDLWECFEKNSNKEVKKVIEAWITKEGYPYVIVRSRKNKVSLEQRRFVAGKKDRNIWPIPLKFLVDNKTLETLFYKKKDLVILEEKPKLIFLNKDFSSFIRTFYTKKLLKEISIAIFKKELNSLERFSVLSDLFAFSKIDKIDLNNFVNFLYSFQTEDNWLVLSLLSRIIFHIERFFGKSKKLEEILVNTFRKNLEKVGIVSVKNEPFENSKIRTISTVYLVNYGEKEIVEKCMEMFNYFENLDRNIIRQVSFCASYYGNEETFQKLASTYKTSSEQELKLVSLAGLANFRDKELLLKSIDFVFREVRIQDYRSFFAILSNNPLFFEISFSLFNENFEKIEGLKENTFVFRDLIKSFIVSCPFDKLFELREILKLFEKNYKITINYSFEIAQINKNWFEKNKGKINF